jgi:hypothetical protein
MLVRNHTGVVVMRAIHLESLVQASMFPFFKWKLPAGALGMRFGIDYRTRDGMGGPASRRKFDRRRLSACAKPFTLLPTQ